MDGKDINCTASGDDGLDGKMMAEVSDIDGGGGDEVIEYGQCIVWCSGSG